MPTIKTTARILTVAALAASTALSSPLLAMAQQQPALRLAQATTDEVVPPVGDAPADATPPEPAPAAEAPPADAAAPAPAEQPPAEQPAAEPAPAEPAAAAPAPAAAEPAPAEPAPAPEPAPDAPADPAPAAPAPSAEVPAPEAETPPAAPAAEPAAEAAPVPDAAKPATADTPPAGSDAPPPAPVAPAADSATPPAAPATEPPAATSAPAPDAAAPATSETPPAAADAPPPAPAAPAAEPAPAPAAPAPDAAKPAAADTPPAGSEASPPAPATEAAPVAAPDRQARGGERRARGDEKPQAVPADVQTAPVEQGAIDRSDARVQTLATPVVEQPIAAQKGERVERAPAAELPPEAKVVKRVGNRDIITLGAAAIAGAAAGAAAGYFIRSNDDERLAVDSRDHYTERLPHGRTRETIVRDNGAQVVTITNRYGDVVQRSRIRPDGREVVLFYDPYSEEDARPDYYSDAGQDLPPLELTIPRDRYIVDVDQPDEELYFDTIVAPPVETVERIYSVDEVRRSSRIRDKVRRIDLNTVHFDFGSATIPQAEVKNLQALADAVGRVIKDNPGETFLIEGHTDAVGSNVANLALSDQRAEAVATALTEYFQIPPENLITQGYGEEDLKVQTQEPSAENRRVTLRRITALVKPVTAAAR